MTGAWDIIKLTPSQVVSQFTFILPISFDLSSSSAFFLFFLSFVDCFFVLAIYSQHKGFESLSIIFARTQPVTSLRIVPFLLLLFSFFLVCPSFVSLLLIVQILWDYYSSLFSQSTEKGMYSLYFSFSHTSLLFFCVFLDIFSPFSLIFSLSYHPSHSLPPLVMISACRMST